MALLWQKQTRDTCYEVRTAGSSRRLYTNGVFHSQYRPGRTHSGGIWDLLVVPAFFRPPGRIRRVLLLGVGGGSAIHLLRQFVEPVEIVGVELSKTHLQIARQFFGIEKNMATLHHADAVKWLQEYDGPPFDFIKGATPDGKLCVSAVKMMWNAPCQPTCPGAKPYSAISTKMARW